MKDFDGLIKDSLKSEITPTPGLNGHLKAQIRQKARREVSLWYVPMVLNTLLFLLVYAMAPQFFGAVTWLVRFFAFYAILTGIVLTLVGVKYLDFKHRMAILW